VFLPALWDRSHPDSSDYIREHISEESQKRAMTDRTADRIRSAGDSTTRRHLLRGLLAAGLVAGGAGCISNVGRGPDPDVVWDRTDPELDNVTARENITVTAMVVNVGDPGEVEVIAETRVLGREEPLDNHSLVLDMERDEQRQISFEMTVSPAAEVLEARAETE
jgi:hypothetical protein